MKMESDYIRIVHPDRYLTKRPSNNTTESKVSSSNTTESSLLTEEEAIAENWFRPYPYVERQQQLSFVKRWKCHPVIKQTNYDFPGWDTMNELEFKDSFAHFTQEEKSSFDYKELSWKKLNMRMTGDYIRLVHPEWLTKKHAGQSEVALSELERAVQYYIIRQEEEEKEMDSVELK